MASTTICILLHVVNPIISPTYLPSSRLVFAPAHLTSLLGYAYIKHLKFISVYHLCGSAWCVITHLKFCALCLSRLCVVCVRAWFGGDKSHITRRGAGRVLPTQAGCAPWVQLTLPHHAPALSPTCLSLRGRVKARNKGCPHLL